MKVFFAILVSMFSLSALGAAPQTSPKAVITTAQLQEMFSNMRANPKWNIDAPLLWGYYFIDPDPKWLQLAAQELTARGYRFVDIHATDDKSAYVLHVEKVEHHTVESLNKRNQEFYALAETFKLSSYDGMDVGPIK
jgi:hypothetical protein